MNKIETTHLQRRAVIYLRQSTLKQLYEHRESTARQYALQHRAALLGWHATQIDVIDEDLGQSGAVGHCRAGFQRLAEDVAHGRVGAIFALEVSRLSRSSADWHRLLELCNVADVVLVDEQTVYTPRDPNDRLLLGLKGTMSEAEQYWMRLRLRGGALNKARRGELFIVPAGGYVWDETTSRLRLDPDEGVQRAIRLLFERFRIDGSARAVARYFVQHGLDVPVRGLSRAELRWVAPRETLVLRMLHNPTYAGAYVYGRHEQQLCLLDGQMQRRTHKLPQAQWKVCLRDDHPAYIDWDEYMANQRKLDDNRTYRGSGQHGAGREGNALLQGLLLCGRCGHRMHTQYAGSARRGVYNCKAETAQGQCWSLPASRLDEAVVQLFLDAIKPPQIELGLAVLRESERQVSDIDRQWKLRMERACYEAKLAERRYKAVDPDNRVIARTLEREWNDKLVEVEQLEREQTELRQRQCIELSTADRAQILALSRDLPAVWHAGTTTNAERKNLLRMLVREVTLTPIDVPVRGTRVQVLWQTGAMSELVVERADAFTVRATPPQALAFIRGAFDDKDDTQIAAELNRRAIPTGVNQAWTKQAVQRVRYSEGLYRTGTRGSPARAPAHDEHGRWSIQAIAAHLGVKPAAVRYWMHSGVLKPHARGGPGHPAWFEIDEATLDRLRQLKSQMQARRTLVHRSA